MKALVVSGPSAAVPVSSMKAGQVGTITAAGSHSSYVGLTVMRVGPVMFDMNDPERYWANIDSLTNFEVKLLPSGTILEVTI